MRALGNTSFLEPSVLTATPVEPPKFGKAPLSCFPRGAQPSRRHCRPLAAARGGRYELSGSAGLLCSSTVLGRLQQYLHVCRQDLNDKAYKTGETLRHRCFYLPHAMCLNVLLNSQMFQAGHVGVYADF